MRESCQVLRSAAPAPGWCHAFLQPLSRLSRAPLIVTVALVLLLAGCSSPARLPPVPRADVQRAMPLGLANARFFPSLQRDALEAEFMLAVERQRQLLGVAPDAKLPSAEMLAISGGGDNGAFGAGVLCGWTAAGDRPEFELVTGVSTGSLLAPFAFLGPAYDEQLKAVYTTITADDVYRERGLVNSIFNDAFADTTPLFEHISKYFDEAMMTAIAEEYRKGRLLLIASTDLDAQTPSIWNIGAIAASGRPGALDLIRNILRASAAVPGFFQPVMIDVEIDGVHYQELHVDGGAIAQMFLYPTNIDPDLIAHRKRTAYLILNARDDPEWSDVDRRTLSIAGRAISTMIHYSGTNDLMRIYYTAQDEGIDYNLAYIGDDFTAPETGDFDKVYMNALFDYAYQQGAHGYPWLKAPPFAGE
jgi:hypothetical protein